MKRKNRVTAYVYASDLRAQANLKRENYCYEYIREINEQLGLRAVPVSRQILKDVARLNEISILFIGDLTPNEIAEGIVENMDVWVKGGGVLIRFATQGLDNIVGNQCAGIRQQPTDDYTIGGYFDLLPAPFSLNPEHRGRSGRINYTKNPLSLEVPSKEILWNF